VTSKRAAIVEGNGAPDPFRQIAEDAQQHFC
jgi:hypothetical protein